MADSTSQRVLQGDLDDLPSIPSKIIRIFLSSTFTDYAEERNLVMKDAIPRLKTYCRQKGYDLEIADMRWGVRDDAQDDHTTTDLCLREIRNCRTESAGPYFVTFLGNKYGFRPYPNIIDVTEFMTLKQAARIGVKDVSLLDEWYLKDENSVPATYVLQPITTKYPHYNDESDENEDLRKKDRADWDAVSTLLGETFRAAANLAFKYKKFTAEQRHKYFQSVTEDEVYEGILCYPDENRTLCFLRDFENINHEDKLAWRFVDIEGGLINKEPQELLKNLKTTRVPRAMKKYNTESYSIPWESTGIDQNNPQHSAYLDDFNEKFYMKVMRQIDASIDKRTKDNDTNRQVYHEALHHATFCQEKCRNFCGRREILKTIQQKMCEVFEPDILEEEVLDEEKTQEKKAKKPKKKVEKDEDGSDVSDEEDEEAQEETEEPEQEPVTLSPDGRKENLLQDVIEEVDEEAVAAEEEARAQEATTAEQQLAEEQDAEKKERKRRKKQKKKEKKAARKKRAQELGQGSDAGDEDEEDREEKKRKKKLKKKKKQKKDQSGSETDDEMTLEEKEEKRIQKERKKMLKKKSKDGSSLNHREKRKLKKEIRGRIDALQTSSDSEQDSSLSAEQKEESKAQRKKNRELKKKAKKELKALESSSDSDNDLTKEQKQQRKQEKAEKKAAKKKAKADKKLELEMTVEQKSEMKKAKREKKQMVKDVKLRMKELDSTSDSEAADADLNEEDKLQKSGERKERKEKRKTLKKELKDLESSDSSSSDKSRSSSDSSSDSSSGSSSDSSSDSSESGSKSSSSEAAQETEEPKEQTPSENQDEQKTEIDQIADMAAQMNVGFASEVDEINLNEARLKELVTPPLTSYSKPLFISGPSGSGKTALMAKLTQLANGWFEKDIMKIIRFLGTSPGTSSLRNTLIGICEQICATYDHRTIITATDLEKDFSFLWAYFQALLRRIDTDTRPLLIILDSLDQLAADDYVFSMNWLEARLPPGVMLVVSMLPDHHGALDNAKNVVSCDRFLEVAPLPRDTAVQLLDTWLADVQRTLTESQRELLLTAHKMCPQPLFLKIAFEDAKTWRSYMPVEEVDIGVSVRSAIETMFVKLERAHGDVLVSRALGYLTVSKNGLSSAELEDVLSLDDEVLQDTYLYHLPPNAELVRLPPLLWKRIQYDLQPYLTVRRADGKNLINWYHRQFREVARQRYSKDNIRLFLHASLADYFTGKWADVAKPLELYKKKKGTYPLASRGAPSQPIIYDKGGYNQRKLSELPHHLTEGHDFVNFALEVAHNLEFLVYKCKTISAVALLNDFSLASKILSKLETLPKPKDLRKRRTSRLQKDTTFLTKEQTHLMAADADEAFEDMDVSNEEDEKTSSDMEDSDAGSIGSQGDQNLKMIKDEIGLVHDMLKLSLDSISKDAFSLPIQILGQLGPTPASRRGLESLRLAALEFVKSTRQPLMTPASRCLPSIGGELLGTVELAIAFAGDASELECKLALTADGQYLYSIDHSNRGGDTLKILDLANSGTVMKLERLDNMDIKNIKLVANDQYLWMDVYKRREKYSPEFYTRILNTKTRIPVTIPEGYRPMSMSKSGAFLLLTKEIEAVAGLFGMPPPVKDCDPNETRMEVVGALMKLQDNSVFPLKVQAKGRSRTQMIYGLISPDDKHTFIACSDKRRYVHTTDKCKLKNGFGDFGNTWGTNTESSQNMHFLDNVRVVAPNASAGLDEKSGIQIFDTDKGKVLYDLREHNYAVSPTCLSRDGAVLATGTGSTSVTNGVSDKFVYVWDLARGVMLSCCRAKGPYNALAFAGDRSEYVMASRWRETHIEVWYAGTLTSPCKDGLLIYRVLGHNREIFNLLVTPDNSTLITGSADNTVKFWSLARILKVCDERLEAAGTDVMALQALMAPPGRPYESGEGPVKTTAITVSRDGSVAAVGTADGWVIFYDLSTMTKMKYHNTGSGVTQLLTSQDGKYIVSIAGNAEVWDPKTGEKIRELKGTKRPDCMAEAQNLLVTGEGGMEAYGHLFNLDTGEKLQTFQGLYGFSQVVISSNAKRIVTTFFDFPLIYDSNSAEPLNFSQPDTMMAGSTFLAVSPNDQYVVSCSTDGSVRVNLLENGEYKYRMQHKSSVPAAAFSKNASILLTSGFKNIIVWSMKDGSLMYMLSRHQDFVTQMTFACGGRYLVSCSDDKQVVVWDMRQRISVAHFTAHCPIRHMSVDQDLKCILYAPENVDYLAVLQPNPVMRDVIQGKATNQVSSSVQMAQAFALSFSNQQVATNSSQACAIL